MNLSRFILGFGIRLHEMNTRVFVFYSFERIYSHKINTIETHSKLKTKLKYAFEIYEYLFQSSKSSRIKRIQSGVLRSSFFVRSLPAEISGKFVQNRRNTSNSIRNRSLCQICYRFSQLTNCDILDLKGLLTFVVMFVILLFYTLLACVCV